MESWQWRQDTDLGASTDIVTSLESGATAALGSLDAASGPARHADLPSLSSIKSAAPGDFIGDVRQIVSSAGDESSLDADDDAAPTSIHAGSPVPGFMSVRHDDDAVKTSAVDPSLKQLVVPAGGTVELGSAFSGTVSFAGATGTLKIDNAATFTGKIAGQLAIGDVIDFANITAGANAKISYSGNNSPGTLTVSDGTHTASVALQGNYSLANFTASSDGHGGTSVVDPPLPAGVTLKAIDGGPTYYASHGFTDAVSMGWDNPNFFPIGPWESSYSSQTDVNTWAALGWNTAFSDGGINQSLAASHGISVIESAEGGISGSFGSNVVGLLSADEPPTFQHGVSTPLGTTANSIQDGRFWYMNDTWSWIWGQGLSGAPGTGSPSSILSDPITTPDGTQRHIDINSIDAYWFAGDKSPEDVYLYPGKLVYGLSGNMTPDQAERGSNYGDMIDVIRSYQTSNPAPIFSIIEDGQPFTSDPGNGSTYITPSELNWATWSSLIHGARGVIYFDHSFSGPGAANVNVEQSYYQTVQPGQTISIYGQIQATDALVKQMAPVLNSPFALNYVSVSPAGYTYNTPTLSLSGGVEVMAKDYNGQVYIFSDTRDSETQTNIHATFTIADKNATSVTVVNENRSIAVVNGVFTDTFATAATVHIYEVNDGTTVTPPPAPPSAPTIDTFSSDTGVAGDHITSDTTPTLTGTAVANSTVAVFDGTKQIGTATANGSGQWTLTTPALSNGTHNLTATDTVSGQTSAASAAFAVTVDTHVPAAPVLVSDSIVNTNHILLTGTAEANSTVQVFDGTTKVGTATASSSGAWSLTTGALTSGSHSFTATATDAAGTTSATSAALLSVKVPTASTPPAAPSITSFSPDTGVAGDGITSTKVLDLKGTADPNSTVTIYDGSTKLGTATVLSTGSWDYITSVLTNAKHVLTAKETNSSGLTSAASAALTVTVDTHVPAAPVVASDSVVNTNQVLLSGTAEANSKITVYDGTTVVGTGTTSATGAWSVTTSALSSGAHALTATATDVAGTVSAVSQAVDPVIPTSKPPAAPSIASFSPDTGVAGDHITDHNSLTLSGTAVADSTVHVFDGKTQIGTATANSSGQWSLTTPALSDGSHSLTATDTLSGQTSAASAAFAITVDTHAPAAPTMAIYSQAGAAVGSTTALVDLVLKGTAEAGSKIDIFDAGTKIGTATTSSAGAWSFDTGTIVKGSHSFTATATDVAGNSSAASKADAVTVTTPTASHPIEFTDVSYEPWNHTATITGTADANSQIKLYSGTTALGTVTTSANGTWSLTNTHMSNSTLYTIKAQELNSSGHVVETSSGAAILGAGNTSTFSGTGGDDYMYSSSSYMNDTFVFASNFGHSAIQGFTTSGAGHDTIQFSKSVFDSFASVLAHASQVGQDVVIASGNDTLKLLNTKIGALNSQDFHFA